MAKRRIVCLAVVLGPSVAAAQTPEADLQRCLIAEIAQYQPTSSYSFELKCDVGNKKPLGSPPHKGPYLDGVSYPGYTILDATSAVTFKISGGGNTPPTISPSKDRVDVALWCEAEDKDFGAGGHYHVLISGTKQRIPTGVERRRVLQHCSDGLQGRFF